MAQVSEISFQFLLLNIRRHEYVPRRLRFAFRSRIECTPTISYTPDLDYSSEHIEPEAFFSHLPVLPT